MNNNFKKKVISRAVSAGLGRSSSLVFAGVLMPFLAVSAPAAVAVEGASAGYDKSIEEVLVMARRKGEDIQDVPQTINALGTDEVNKLGMLGFEDVEMAIPGLTLETGGNGFSSSASLRGVGFSADSGASPTVEFYLNDAPVESNLIFQSMFDVGQIEVLSGPQGTLRGRSAPSGAITITSKKPDLQAISGYVSSTATNLNGENIQGALNLPVLEDKLAVRIAGVVDKNEANGVRSINNAAEPKQKTEAIRASVTFLPVESVDINLMYQKLDKYSRSYMHVAGAGAPGGMVPGKDYEAPPQGFNGPVISPGSRLSITDGYRTIDQENELFVAQANWRVAGQVVSYVGASAEQDSHSLAPEDRGNTFKGFEYYKPMRMQRETSSHEIRISSEDRIADFFSYTAGIFTSETAGKNGLTSIASFQPGAFGSPLANPVLASPNMDFIIPLATSSDYDEEEFSVFVNFIFNITDSTEVSIGGRQIRNEMSRVNDILLSPGKTTMTTSASFPPPLGNLPISTSCGLAGGKWEASYAGVCDVAMGASVLQHMEREEKNDNFIYSASISHRINDSLLVYANTGSAWRRGPSQIGITSQYDETLESMIFLDPEESVSYEIGFKSSFMDGRGRLNASLYHQKFEDYFYQSDLVRYLSVTPRSVVIDAFQFTANADATVTGIDIDLSFDLMDNWTASLGGSYAKGKLDDEVPCNDSNFDGIPDGGLPSVTDFQAYGKYVATCQSDGALSRSPDWRVTVQSEYFLPVARSMEMFVRGLYSYYPSNDNISTHFSANSYSLLNLYAGVRSDSGKWEVSVFAKNAAKASQLLSIDSEPVKSVGAVHNYFGFSGYNDVNYTPRRELGLTLRYNF